MEAAVRDPLWAQPLTRLYAADLKSKVADLRNVGDGALAGHIAAALYLQVVAAAASCPALWVPHCSGLAASLPRAGGGSSPASPPFCCLTLGRAFSGLPGRGLGAAGRGGRRRGYTWT